MKKNLLSVAIIFALSACTLPAFSTYTLDNGPVLNEEKKGELSIVPNRESGEAQVRFKSNTSGEAIITVTDETGKLLLQQSNQLTSGTNNISITNLLKLNEGVYTVRLKTGSQTYSTSLLLWK